MMIGKFWRCNSCGAIIKTKIGVGYQKETNYKFECERCHQEITLRFIIKEYTDKLGRTNYKDIWIPDGISKSKSNKFDFCFTSHPDFPTRTSDVYSFPFIDALNNRDETDILQRQLRQVFWHELSMKKAKNLKMIYRNYSLGDFENFKKGIIAFQKGSTEFDSKILSALLPGELPLNNNMDKLSALSRVLDACFFPIVVSKNHFELYHYFESYIADLNQTEYQNYNEFVDFLVNNNYLTDIQNKCFEYIFNFLDLSEDFSPVIFEWDPENPDATFPSDANINNNISFDKIKSFSVDGFELLSKSLVIIIGLINIKHRHNYDSINYDPRERNKKPFKGGLIEFNAIANAPKFKLLSEENKFDKWINPVIDSKLRNDIGHFGYTIDSNKGYITYYTNKEKTKSNTITYGEYLFRCIRLLVRVYQVNILVKMIMYQHLIKNTMDEDATQVSADIKI
ncbi:hypothetical protein [Methanocella arvoryzae]|nr:hypothetical protein [Methanocella arvoryzae]